MDIPLSERRQIENEMIFRRTNEEVAEGLEKLNETLIEDDEREFMWDDMVPINFKCECSDENCDQRISMKLSRYKKIHENRKAFIVKPDHQVEKIEKVILKEKNYNVVQKDNLPAEPADSLNSTSIHNV